MRTIVSFSIAVTLGLAIQAPAFAREEEKGHEKARPQAVHAQGGKQSAAATRGGGRIAPGTRSNAIVQRQPGRAPAATAGQSRGFERGGATVAAVAGNPGRGASSERAPANISRGWNHQGQYEWNNHHYGWRGNSWVIIDPGYGYGGYGYQGGPGYGGGGPGGMTAAVQSSLDRQGYNAGPPDGVMGGQTRDAIAGFQATHGLQQTGQIDPPLISALGLQ